MMKQINTNVYKPELFLCAISFFSVKLKYLSVENYFNFS